VVWRGRFGRRGDSEGDPQELAERLRRADETRREFVANVSHELRTPIASLRALVDTLEDGALEDPPAAREFLAQMRVEMESLSELVNELLDLSRIESGQAELRRQPVAPESAVRSVVGRLRAQAKQAGVSVEGHVAAGTPDVLADPARLEQVLVNLVHNGVKFTPRGGWVRVRVEPAYVTTLRTEGGAASGAKKGEVVFTVEDSGAGLARSDISRVFERFYKADRSRASSGTGLGLAIAKHVVLAHGGRIWAESEGPGRGARFSFALAAAK
ncbi:MAG TPA: ATP-binding protein, partial [Chloroflexota bacterium]|nr:ATP-binding protein [Chloroflexota bacterium]